MHARFAAVVAISLLALPSGVAHAYQYKSARGLYRDCAAGVAGNTAASRAQWKRCADYLNQVFDGWLLAQSNRTCSQRPRAELPKAYVEYWQARGSAFLNRFRSPSASVKEFLDSEAEPCATPDPKTEGQ